MNKILPAISLTIGLLLLSCQKNGNEPENNVITDPVEQHICVGTWQGGLGDKTLRTLLPKDILIDVKINNDADSTYSLISTYSPGTDTTLKNFGRWHLNSQCDSIILEGTDCWIIEDTIHKTLVNRACVNPIPICIDIQNDVWKVLMTDLLPVAEAMEIDVSNPIITAAAPFIVIELAKLK